MPSLIKPFRGLRPAPGRAADVIAPPYDVMNLKEARALAEGRPWSFLHISRAEIDLPDGTDPYTSQVYEKARANLDQMLSDKVLVRDPQDCYYAYRLTMDHHVQTGLVAVASVDAYDDGRIKKHELTRPVKEDDRVRQIEALNAQTGPVFLSYKANEQVDAILAAITSVPPDISEVASGGVHHDLWVISDVTAIAGLSDAFDAMDALYVADGHHRSAAASRVAKTSPEAAGADYFLSVLFSHQQVQILDYNRVVRDLNGLSTNEFLAKIGEHFVINPSDVPVKPISPGHFGMYLDNGWYQLIYPQEQIPEDPVAALEVSLLSDNLIEPILGIKDQRRDDRIDFVGGIRGMEGLEMRVDSGEMAVAFSLFPTSMEALMAVADAGEIMPPKSTWFEPKLADGLVSHVLD